MGFFDFLKGDPIQRSIADAQESQTLQRANAMLGQSIKELNQEKQEIGRLRKELNHLCSEIKELRKHNKWLNEQLTIARHERDQARDETHDMAQKLTEHEVRRSTPLRASQ